MTIDQVDRLVRGSNPVANLEELEPIDVTALLQETTRRETMQTSERIHVDAPARRRLPVRHLGWAAAIAAVLIGLLVVTSVREAQFSAVSVSAAETATAFLEARQVWDAEAALSYLPEEAKVSIPPARSVEELPMELALLQALGWIYEVDDCSVVEAHKFDDGTRRVLCSVTHHNDLSRALGVGPYTTTRFTMDVRDGLITSVILAVPMASYVNQTAAPFFDWLTENHPEDIEAMTTLGTITPALTVESIDLWKRYVAEFVAELQEG